MFVCSYLKSPKVLHRLVWNFDTTLHSNTGVFLYTYYIDFTPVTGKNMLFFEKQHHQLDVKATHTILNILRFHFNVSDCIVKLNFHRFRFIFILILIISCDIVLELSCVVCHSVHFVSIVYFFFFSFSFFNCFSYFSMQLAVELSCVD